MTDQWYTPITCTLAWCIQTTDHIHRERVYRVHLVPEEGPSWWVTVTALDARQAKNKARMQAGAAGEYVSPVTVAEVTA